MGGSDQRVRESEDVRKSSPVCGGHTAGGGLVMGGLDLERFLSLHTVLWGALQDTEHDLWALPTGWQ